MSLIWESLPVYNRGGEMVRATKRARVPGGWLVLVTVNSGSSVESSLTFYPDPEHIWDGHSLDSHSLDSHSLDSHSLDSHSLDSHREN